jgi:hypothetical protein
MVNEQCKHAEDMVAICSGRCEAQRPWRQVPRITQAHDYRVTA